MYSLVVVKVESGIDIMEDNFLFGIQVEYTLALIPSKSSFEFINFKLNTLTEGNLNKPFQLSRHYLQNNHRYRKRYMFPTQTLNKS